VTRKDLRNEADWLPEDFNEVLDITELVASRGHRTDTAKGLGLWLIEKAAGRPDKTAAGTRSRYRRILAELEAAGVPPPRKRRPDPECRQAGLASVSMLTTTAAAGALVAAGHPVAGALVYITGTASEDLAEAA